MISLLSHLKAARAAYLSTTGGRASMISTTPGRMRVRASVQKPQLQLIEEFRSNFWKAAAARSLKRDGAAKNIATAVLPMPNPRAVKKTSSGQDCSKDDHKARHVREDLYKHFHASAASRAMKRHDVVVTNRRCPNEHAESSEKREGVEGVQLLHVEQLLSSIDVTTSIKVREDMRHHFLSSYQAREDARNGSHARFAIHNFKHLQEHRCKLPKTLHAYFEASIRTEEHHRPCPMAITETHPPFKIVDVNDDWTHLCGYTRQEAVGSTLKLLQGPETDAAAVKGLMASLLQQNDRNAEHEAVLVNYTAEGERFKNHVRVGHITNDTGDATTHFVGLFAKLGCVD